MKRTKTVLTCNSFKYKDFMFKGFTQEKIRPKAAYRAVVEDDQLYLVLIVKNVEHYIHLPYLDKIIKDPRFEGSFSELNIEWIVNNGIPDMEDAKQIVEWLDEEEEEFDEEEYYEEKEGDFLDDFIEYPEQNGIVGTHGFNMNDEQLATGVLEALRGVESLQIGILMDDEKEKLLEALKGLILEYQKTSSINDLFMAQYLLFNIISLAKNKW